MTIARTQSQSGFTAVEILIVISILVLLMGIIFTTFVSFRKAQALEKDTETIVEVLSQARSQTLTSQNASVYGVHFAAGAITLFTGSTYAAGVASNQVFTLWSSDTILTIGLTGGGSDVVFARLTGETSQNGTIVVSSPTTSKTKTVTIYKTGLVESQ